MGQQWSLLALGLAVSLTVLAGGCGNVPAGSLKDVQSARTTESLDFTVMALGDEPFTLSAQHGNVVVVYLTSFCGA